MPTGNPKLMICQQHHFQFLSIFFGKFTEVQKLPKHSRKCRNKLNLIRLALVRLSLSSLCNLGVIRAVLREFFFFFLVLSRWCFCEVYFHIYGYILIFSGNKPPPSPRPPYPPPPPPQKKNTLTKISPSKFQTQKSFR